MAFIRATAIDLEGNEIQVRYEGPKDKEGRTPIAFLKPSGKTYVNPMYEFGERMGVRKDGHRQAHLGMDGKGNEGVSDQRWIYDLAEAVRLEKDEPTRFVRAEG